MKLSKLAKVLFVSVALLTVGVPIASAAPQAYWTAQPADPSQPGQQAPATMSACTSHNPTSGILQFLADSLICAEVDGKRNFGAE